MVFDLGLGQRGLLDHRPQHRLGALVEPAIHQELADFAHDLRLGVKAHRQIRMVPVADDAEPLEVALLHLDPMRGEIAAFLAELGDRHTVLRLLLLAVGLLDNPLDRQTVAVPAGHVRRVLAEHLLAAIDDVLEDLVERGAEMRFAVGIGRAVMQHEFLTPFGDLAQLLVKPHLFPAGEHRRLAVRQIAAHREVGLGQENGRTVIRWHGEFLNEMRKEDENGPILKRGSGA